jgi:hypothetical protein
MNIVISRDEQTFGPYSKEQAEQFLESGELLSSDLASWEGNEEWVPLESLLSPASDSEQPEDVEEDDPLDDFDHEKMKQWEDVFVDDDDEGGEETASESNQFIDDDFPGDEPPVYKPEESVTSVPPPISEVSEIPEVPALQYEKTDEPLPAVAEAPVPEVEQEEVSEHLAPPPPPAAKSSKSSKSKKTPRPKGEPEAASQLTPRSKKIKGLNSRQTVIVVKGESIFSKIYTASLIFLILLVITCLIVVGGLFFSYESVAPVLEDMGVPSGIIEAFKSQDESSRIDRSGSEIVLSSVSHFEHEKEIADPGGG